MITGDHILYIYGRYMKERGKLVNNTVVTTVMSNFGLYKAFDESGIGYAKTAVGDKYVYEYMTKNGCRIGGEQSGHIIFSKYASTGDGILTSLKMMEVMLARKKKMSELSEGFTVYPQVLKNIRVQRHTRQCHLANCSIYVRFTINKPILSYIKMDIGRECLWKERYELCFC